LPDVVVKDGLANGEELRELGVDEFLEEEVRGP
jgi:hypothetical protein